MAVEKPAKPFVWLRLPSGRVKKHDLPLPKAVEKQLAKRLLSQVADEQGNPLGAEAPAAVPEPEKPKQADPKTRWVEWALHADADLDPEAAEAMTKADLMELYG